MAKSTGLGDNFYLGGYDLSGDVGSLGTISGGNAPIEQTDITQSGMARAGGLRNGTIEFSAYHDDAALAEYPALKTLLTTDRMATYFRGTTVGNAAASCMAKQINYDWTRGADGSLTKAIQVQSTGYGLEWGQQLTGGIRTATGAENGTSIDTAASLSFGAQAYLQVFAFTGTDATVRIADSADDASFATVLTLTQITGGAPLVERNNTNNTTTWRRYIRYNIITTGGFSSLSFALMFVKNPIAGQVF